MKVKFNIEISEDYGIVSAKQYEQIIETLRTIAKLFKEELGANVNVDLKGEGKIDETD